MARSGLSFAFSMAINRFNDIYKDRRVNLHFSQLLLEVYLICWVFL